ncbi:ankyrin [Hypoxylon rubiginosum]|uniref:Ankyrin n=1 Tax=Hypoxylon rubiginosum TaxID=110542 RepID=A0ACC0D6K0_9PEZI|nr:ankyrin [Hypoxylon rubiginosum]
MNLFLLPPEVVDLIFQYIVLSRELSRVMRVRHVSRQFRNYIDDAIVYLRYLSRYVNAPCWVNHLPLPMEYKDQRRAWLSYLCTYFTRQAMRERSNVSLPGRLYRVAKALCEEDGDAGSEAISTCLKSLIRLLASTTRTADLFQEPTNQLADGPDVDLEADIAVAAVYLGRKAHLDRLLAENEGLLRTVLGGFDISSPVFDSAFKAATRQGNLEMINFFLSGPMTANCQRDILCGASLYGHRATFDFALEARSISLPETDAQRRTNYDVPTVYNAIRDTPWPDQYERLAAILGPDSDMFQPHHNGLDSWLTRSAAADKVEMVRYFLAKGASPNPPDINTRHVRRRRAFRPLVRAIRYGSEASAKILLDAGADPNLCPPPRTALMEAAWTRSVSMVKLLLDHGADVNDGRPPPIVLAVIKEHLAMFQLLRERGARLDTPETGGWAMALAKSHGLDSMVELLVSEGVEEDAVLHRVAWHDENQWLYKHLWPVEQRYRLRSNGPPLREATP